MEVTCPIEDFSFPVSCDMYHTGELAGLYILLAQSSE